MPDEETKVTNPMEEDYLKEIQTLKENTVDKDAYDKLREENRKLLNTIVNGSDDEPVNAEEEKPNLDELKKDLFDNDNNNLEFAEKALKLRKAIMDEGGEDPFLPQGKMISANGQDVTSAQRVADALESCVEYANGDSQLFTTELQRITRDVIPMHRK